MKLLPPILEAPILAGLYGLNPLYYVPIKQGFSCRLFKDFDAPVSRCAKAAIRYINQLPDLYPMERKFFYAIATLVGITIGAGILGIPFVVAKSGMLIGLINIGVIGIAVLAVNLYFAEIVLRTKGKHQLTGYAKIYLGTKAKRIMTITMTILIYGAMTAYAIGIGEALNSVYPEVSPFQFSLAFFAIGALILYSGLRAVAHSEFILSSLIIGMIAIIAFIAFFSGHFDTENLKPFNPSNSLVPYGVVLFAFLGSVAIPEMSEELGKKKKLLRNAVIAGSLIPLAAYSLFALAVVGVTGTDTSQIATVGLGETLGTKMLIFVNLFSVLAMATSFLAMGLALKEVYHYDHKLDRKLSWALTCIVPIAAFVIGIKEFVPVIGFVGALSGGCMGIMVVLMHSRAKKLGARKPEFQIPEWRIVSVLLLALFIGGIVYAIASHAHLITEVLGI